MLICFSRLGRDGLDLLLNVYVAYKSVKRRLIARSFLRPRQFHHINLYRKLILIDNELGKLFNDRAIADLSM